MSKQRVNIGELRTRLKEAGCKFGGRTGEDKLIAMAKEKDIVVPLLKTSKSIVPENFRKHYGAAQNCGDEFAEAFAENTTGKDGKLDMEKVAKVAAQNEVDLGRWKGKNNGMVRMNLSNVLRGMQRRGETVKIGSTTIKGEKEGKGAAL